MKRVFQLSDSGLQKVREAIQNTSWGMHDIRWLIEVSRYIEPDRNWHDYLAWQRTDLEAEIATVASISKSTWRRFIQGKSIEANSFVACCKALKLSFWDVVNNAKLEFSGKVIGQHAKYTDPKEYTGCVWTFILPESENICMQHSVNIYWGSWSWHKIMILPENGLLLRYVKRLPDSHTRTIVVSSPIPECRVLVTNFTKITNGQLKMPSFDEVDINEGWEQKWLLPPKIIVLL